MMAFEKKVIIEEINLISFGKFENFKISAESGLNVIYGKNESGKSTIQLFLKAMLYGLPTRKRSGDVLKERERAIPWASRNAKGILTLSVDGRRIEIRRQFGKTSNGDKLEVCDAVSGQVITEYNVNNIGELLFGMSAEMFEKTLWISQNGAFIGGRDDELSKRLMNLKSSGDEAVSVASALEKIEMVRRELKAKDGRSAKGKIDILIERLEECRREKYDLATQLAQTEQSRLRLISAKEEQESVKTKLVELEDEYKHAIESGRTEALRERLRQIEECDKKLNLIYNSNEYKNSEGITEAEIDEAIETERRLSSSQSISESSCMSDKEVDKISKRQQGAGMMLGGGVVLSVIAGISAIILGGFLKNMPAVILSLLFVIIGILLALTEMRVIRNCKNILQANDEEKNRVKIKEKEYDKIRAQLYETLSKYNVSNVTELSKLYTGGLGLRERARSLEEAKLGFLGEDSYEELKNKAETAGEEKTRPLEEIEEELKSNRKSSAELDREIQALGSKMAYETKITKIPSDIDTEINTIRYEIQDSERRLLVLDEAERAIHEAGDSWKLETLPQLNNKVAEIFDKITNHKYNAVRVSDEYKMRILSAEELYDAEYLSFGTYEQIYLSLRLAIAELVSEGKILFFDDILTTYDDERAVSVMKHFEEISREWQIFVFTCHRADKENADALGGHTITI